MFLSDRALQAKPVKCGAELGDHLKCSACSLIAFNGFQTCHGCRLCQDCVAKKLDKTERCICPCTSGPFTFREEKEIKELLVNQLSCQPDTGTRREVSELTVRCPNSECPERMEWKKVQRHLDNECDFELVSCDLCHRQIVCYELRTDAHYNLDSENCCVYYRGLCPLCRDATLSLNRCDFVEHSKTCSKRQIKCKYSCIGCSVVTSSVQMDEHFRDCTDKHLQMTVERLCCENRSMKELQADQLDAVQLQKEQEQVQFRQEMKQLMQQMQSEMEQKLRLELSQTALKLKSDLQQVVQNEIMPKLEMDLQQLVQNELKPKLKMDFQELMPKFMFDLQELVLNELKSKIKVDLPDLVQTEVEDKLVSHDNGSKPELEEHEGKENLKSPMLKEHGKDEEKGQKERELSESPKLLEENAKQKELRMDHRILEIEHELAKMQQKILEMESHQKKPAQKSSWLRDCGPAFNESEEHLIDGGALQTSSRKAQHEARNSTQRRRTKSSCEEVN